jgi:hypothetical protein
MNTHAHSHSHTHTPGVALHVFAENLPRSTSDHIDADAFTQACTLFERHGFVATLSEDKPGELGIHVIFLQVKCSVV